MGVNENSLFYFYFGEKFVTCCFFHFMLYTSTFFSQFLCPLNFPLNSFKNHNLWYNVKLHNGYKNWLYSVSTECLWGKSVSLMYIIFTILRNFHSFIIHIFMILGGLNLQVSDFLWTPLNEYLSNEHFAVYMSSSTVCINDWILLLIMDDHGYVCWRFNVCV